MFEPVRDDGSRRTRDALRRELARTTPRAASAGRGAPRFDRRTGARARPTIPIRPPLAPAATAPSAAVTPGRAAPHRSVEDLTDQVRAARAALATLRDEVDRERAEHHDEVTRLRGERDGARKRTHELEARVAQLTADIEVVLADLDDANDQIDAMAVDHADVLARVRGEHAVAATRFAVESERLAVLIERLERRGAPSSTVSRLLDPSPEVEAEPHREDVEPEPHADQPTAFAVPSQAVASLDELVSRIEHLKAQIRSQRDE